jgi:hypothetical protein
MTVQMRLNLKNSSITVTEGTNPVGRRKDGGHDMISVDAKISAGHRLVVPTCLIHLSYDSRRNLKCKMQSM